VKRRKEGKLYRQVGVTNIGYIYIIKDNASSDYQSWFVFKEKEVEPGWAIAARLSRDNLVPIKEAELPSWIKNWKIKIVKKIFKEGNNA
jgi:hypothetical protein